MTYVNEGVEALIHTKSPEGLSGLIYKAIKS